VADPSKLDFADWFSVVVAAVLSGMAGAMGWFRGSKKDLESRMLEVETDMRNWDKANADHQTQLAVLQTCQSNTQERLGSIDETTRDTNQSLKELSQTVTQVLLAIQAKK